jgi:DNA-directed RNA polymerase specialized sigma24 family protein
MAVPSDTPAEPETYLLPAAYALPEAETQQETERAAKTISQFKVTEEIKSLVSKMYREGQSVENIAQVADLSKTEVELILAVREHHMESLISDLQEEDEDFPDRNQLVRAIHDLSLEGASTRDIAKKLNISLSEVMLAYSIIEKETKDSELS